MIGGYNKLIVLGKLVSIFLLQIILFWN